MVDVLFTHANHLFLDRKQARKMQPYPPLQTLILAALLRQHGRQVAFFDSTFDAPEAGFAEALDRHRPRLVAVCEDNFNFVTKMCLLRNREVALELGRAARECGIRAVVNSSDATEQPKQYLPAFDAVLVGEPEDTLLETAACLLDRDSRELSSVAGVAYRNGADGLRRTPSRPLLADLDRLPLPAWDLVDVERYREAWARAHGYFSLNLVSSRGCPYRCNWCAKPIHGQSYQSVSPERAAEEMLFIKRRYAPDHVWFADDIFALSPSWTRAFADAVEARGARLSFKMQSRCDLMVRDTVASLRRAGCTEVWMGAESGSQTVLDAMEKGTRVEEIYAARENLRRHGIRACYFLQFGYPGEGWEEIERTVRMVRETDPDDIGVSVSYPLPGTTFYDRVASELGPRQNWSDSDDLAVMFRGRYSTDFYRMLRDALHLEVDLRHRDTTPPERARLEELWSRVRELERQPCGSC